MLHVEELLVLCIEQILILNNLQTELLAPSAHLDFPVLDDRATKVLQNAVHVLRADDNTFSSCECLDHEHPVLDRGQHFLDRRNLVHNVQMVPFVFS